MTLPDTGSTWPNRSKSIKLSLIGVINVAAATWAASDRGVTAPGVSITMKSQVLDNSATASTRVTWSSAAAVSRNDAELAST